MARKPKLPPKLGRLKELLNYDPDSGIFTWKIDRGSGGAIFRVSAGSVAGGKTINGYVTIGIDGTPYLAHRLAWFYVHGDWPDEIDHRDRNRSNNAIDNLRPASHGQNCTNRPARSNSGIIGVSSKRHNRWQAYIEIDGKSINLGSYKTIAEAAAARAKAEGDLWRG